MQIGSKEISLHNPIEVRPIDKRSSRIPKAFSEWTVWKGLALFSLSTGCFALLLAIKTWQGLESTTPTWVWFLMSFQAASSYGYFQMHKAALAFKSEHPGMYYGFF